MYNFRKQGGTRGRKVNANKLRVFKDPVTGRKYNLDTAGRMYYVN